MPILIALIENPTCPIDTVRKEKLWLDNGNSRTFPDHFSCKNVTYFLFSPLGLVCYFHVTWKLTQLANRSSREHEKSHSTHLSSKLCFSTLQTKKEESSFSAKTNFGREQKSQLRTAPCKRSAHHTALGHLPLSGSEAMACSVCHHGCRQLGTTHSVSIQPACPVSKPNRGTLKIGAESALVPLQTTNQQVCFSAKFPSDTCLNKGFVNFH